GAAHRSASRRRSRQAQPGRQRRTYERPHGGTSGGNAWSGLRVRGHRTSKTLAECSAGPAGRQRAGSQAECSYPAGRVGGRQCVTLSSVEDLPMATRLWLGAALVLATNGGAPATGNDEDVPAMLERQTQELLDAITAGSSAVWERLLDPRV